MPILPENPVHLPVEKLSLGCPILDRFLAGGIPFGFITEISGESSAGKTQICLQILLTAASPPSSASSLFISTEPPFPLRRLISLSSDSSLLNHIFIRSAFSSKDLFNLLKHIDTILSSVRLSSGRRIRIIVLDSVAAIFHNDAEDAARRSPELFSVAAKLKEQARRFNLAVIVTNHVVDVVEDDSRVGFSGNCMSLCSSRRRVWPAMGLAWANCVNMRIFVSRDEEGEGNLERKLQVVFAPHLPGGSCEFVIGRDGVFGVGDRALIPTLMQNSTVECYRGEQLMEFYRPISAK